MFQEFPFLNREFISPKREFHSLKREFYSLIRKFHSVQSEFDFLQGEDFFNEITKLFSQKIKCTVKLDYKKATNNSTLAELGPAQLSLFIPFISYIVLVSVTQARTSLCQIELFALDK